MIWWPVLLFCLWCFWHAATLAYEAFLVTAAAGHGFLAILAAAAVFACLVFPLFWAVRLIVAAGARSLDVGPGRNYLGAGAISLFLSVWILVADWVVDVHVLDRVATLSPHAMEVRRAIPAR